MQADLARLDEAHRTRQAAIAAAAGIAVLRMWGDLREEDVLDVNSPAVDRFLTRSTPLVLSAHRRSQEAASGFYTRVRDLQVPNAPDFEVPVMDLPPVDQIRTSLFVTGVVGARKRISKLPTEARIFSEPAPQEDLAGEAPSVEGLNSFFERQRAVARAGRQSLVEEALVKSGEGAAAATFRHAANGGRNLVKEAVKRDPVALGYVRVTRGDYRTCYFCAMLASRGKVYKDDSFDQSDPRFEGPGTAKVHDSCRCTMRPIYTRNDDELPEFGRAMQDLWEDSDAWPEIVDGRVDLAWRQMYEARAKA